MCLTGGDQTSKGWEWYLLIGGGKWLGYREVIWIARDCKCTLRGEAHRTSVPILTDLFASNLSFSFQILSHCFSSHNFGEGKSSETKSGTENLGLGLIQTWAYFPLLFVPLHKQKRYPLVRTSIAPILGFLCLQIFYCLQYAKTFDSCAYCKQSKAGGWEELGTRLATLYGQ